MEPISNKEITLLNLLLKLSTNFWTQTKGKNNVSLQNILPTIQKSKNTFTSQLSNQFVNDFIKTGFVLSALKQVSLHLGEILNSSVLLTKFIQY